MSYYQEILLLPDEETPASFLWSKVFTQLHIGFADWKNRTGRQPFAVSFPDYARKRLGRKIRLITPKAEDLEGFDSGRWLERFRDYTRISPIHPVPDTITGWAVFDRWHEQKVMPSRIHRYIRRHPECTYEEAEKILSRQNPDKIPPFIWMKSLTNRGKFCLFIQKKPAAGETLGELSSYGLSPDHAVPEF